MIEILLKFLSSIPHFNFKFQRSNAKFNLDFRSEYAQSLALFAGASGAVLVLLLLTIVITWICQCCSKQPTTVKSRRKVKRLSTFLFLISVACFFCLGFSLFGNDYINRGVSTSLIGLEDVSKGFKLAVIQTDNLNRTCFNATTHLHDLDELIKTKSTDPNVNKTMVEEVHDVMRNLSNSINGMSQKLTQLDDVLKDVSFLEKAKTYGERVEIERWLLLVLVQSIQMCVLFAGVIAFCRQSNKGAVIFSALGIVIFLVVWTLVAFVLPATIALSDFCTNGGAYINGNLGKQMISTLQFYRTCDARPTHDNVPSNLGVKNVSDELSALQATKTKLDSLLDVTFNRSAEVMAVSALVSTDGSTALKAVGALESTLACYAYKDDVRSLHYGLCDQSVVGAAVLLLCLLLLGILLFVLLLVVSKSWRLFTRSQRSPSVSRLASHRHADFITSLDSQHPRSSLKSSSLKRVSFRPSDYDEVEEDDPFFPRTTDSAIPVDIYGTHMFNPRTRERTDPSTGTTSANTNGTVTEDVTQPLWRPNPTAPVQTYSRNTGLADQYGNYNNERYDIQ